MGADDAALLGLDGFGQAEKFEVKVSMPVESDSGEFGNCDTLDDQVFHSEIAAHRFCEATARRGLRAVLYQGTRWLGEYE